VGFWHHVHSSAEDENAAGLYRLVYTAPEPRISAAHYRNRKRRWTFSLYHNFHNTSRGTTAILRRRITSWGYDRTSQLKGCVPASYSVGHWFKSGPEGRLSWDVRGFSSVLSDR
jgi:hypothetical protein